MEIFVMVLGLFVILFYDLTLRSNIHSPDFWVIDLKDLGFFSSYLIKFCFKWQLKFFKNRKVVDEINTLGQFNEDK